MSEFQTMLNAQRRLDKALAAIGRTDVRFTVGDPDGADSASGWVDLGSHSLQVEEVADYFQVDHVDDGTITFVGRCSGAPDLAAAILLGILRHQPHGTPMPLPEADADVDEFAESTDPADEEES